MKALHLIFAFLVLTFSASCSSSSDDDTNTNPTSSNENTWTFNNHTYKQNGPIIQGTDYYPTDNKPFTITQATTVTPSSNGLFSTVKFYFNTHEAGTYTVKSQNTMVSNLDAKYIYIEAFIGNTQNQGASYGSIDGNITVTVEKVDGKFIITAANAIAMSKLLDTGLNSPASATFTCNKVK